MKIFTAGYNPEKKGGAHSFLSNFRKCFKDQLVETPEEADIVFVTSVSMLGKLNEIPQDKKIVLRVDNILKRSCNRDIYPFRGDKVSMMEAMRILAQRADLVVYQSQWAKNLLDGFLRPSRGIVILNSADETIFNPDGTKLPKDHEIFFYSRSSNHDNKQWHKVYYDYIEKYKENPKRELWIAGRFSPENIPNNFDFYGGENIKYLGFIQDPEAMALYMRSVDRMIFPYAFDACSNTLIEFLLTNGNVEYLELSGGTPEIKEKFEKYGREYFYLERMKNEYKKALEGL